MPDINVPAVSFSREDLLHQLSAACLADNAQAAALLSRYLSAFYPKADGKLTLNEFGLLLKLKQLAPDTLRLGLKCRHGAYELWIICNTKDYALLEQASALMADYERRTKTAVNGIWVTEERLQNIPQPRFIFTL
ncbi:hypothetical protein [Acetanaerobacterium elongatum]|uniref:Uncharacterized protein n=1 Tax=Acetanaerobacterium elongatum TaxID=258515 RepID=A0A1H0GKR0_9FIRM|nr:hypothetical protein [Acetanaerobacterium elongatum]SDO07464.1 hypothetical protein SAMN05192585_1524 [Acetanaerobacterium elongatum]